jgi:hypothetical protein
MALVGQHSLGYTNEGEKEKINSSPSNRQNGGLKLQA